MNYNSLPIAPGRPHFPASAIGRIEPAGEDKEIQRDHCVLTIAPGFPPRFIGVPSVNGHGQDPDESGQVGHATRVSMGRTEFRRCKGLRLFIMLMKKHQLDIYEEKPGNMDRTGINRVSDLSGRGLRKNAGEKIKYFSIMLLKTNEAERRFPAFPLSR